VSQGGAQLPSPVGMLYYSEQIYARDVFSLAGFVSPLHLSSQHVDPFLNKQWANRPESATYTK